MMALNYAIVLFCFSFDSSLERHLLSHTPSLSARSNANYVQKTSDVEKDPKAVAFVESFKGLTPEETVLFVKEKVNPSNVNMQDLSGSSMLHYATLRGYERAVQLLLTQGASPNLTDDLGRTPLFYGLESVPILQILKASGATFNIESKYGETALMRAAVFSSKEICTYLLNQGININKQDHQGETALFSAAYAGRRDLVELLLKHRADANIVSKSGKLAFMDAAGAGDIHSLRLLLKATRPQLKKKKISDALFHAIELRSVEAIVFKPYPWHMTETLEILVKEGANINALSKNQGGLINATVSEIYSGEAYAISYYFPVLDWLVRHKINLNTIDTQGDTALITAVKTGKTMLVDFLLVRGADPSLRNKQGKSALDIARELKRSKKHLQIEYGSIEDRLVSSISKQNQNE